MKRYISVVLLGLILISALCVRKNTFWINHWMGDQCYYLSLAMKLEKDGLGDYNVRGVDVGSIDLTREGDISLKFPKPAEEGRVGLILSALIATGNTHYDVPLFVNAPAFPSALLVSHKIFARKGQPFTAVFSRGNRILAKEKPYSVFQAQFFAAVVPVFFSLMTLVMIFLLGKFMFSSKIGVMSAFLYSIHPISIFTAQRIWADDMLTFFITASVFSYLISFRRSKCLFALAAGFLCGAAILAKQTAVFLIPAVWCYSFLFKLKDTRNFRTALSAAFNLHFLIFLSGAAAVTWFWFYEVYRVYGSPFHVPSRDFKAYAEKDLLGWHKLVFQRPHTYILFGIGIPYLCPLFSAAYASCGRFVRDCGKMIRRAETDLNFVMLWLWILVFYLASFLIGKEYRYMLPILPPLAVLSAIYLDKLREAVQSRTNAVIAGTVIFFLFTACCLWSVPIGQNAVMDNKTLILKPF